MLGELSPWHLLILAAVALLFFGAKRLPDSARSLGRAMRIFKAETQGLRSDGTAAEPQAAPQVPQALAATPPVAAPLPGQAPVAAAAPVDAQRANPQG